MPRQRFDMGSKWLLHNQGKGALRIGGFTDVRRLEAMPGEIVQNRKYPDGLLRVYFGQERKPQHVLIEVATYAEERALRQALDDLTLSYQALGELPELLMLVLRPKGRFRLGGLKFSPTLLAEFFAGEQTMFESPVLQQFVAKRLHEAILDLLKDRFESVPPDVTERLRTVINEKKLRKFNVLAAKCPNLEAFREALLA